MFSVFEDFEANSTSSLLNLLIGKTNYPFMNLGTKRTYPYLDRDISWLYFNARVLQEACDHTVPLLERLKFLAIYSSNLDEFFRVRVASNAHVAQTSSKNTRAESDAAKALVHRIYDIDAQYATQYAGALADAREDLADQHIRFVDEAHLTQEQQHYVRCWFRSDAAGFIAPLWLNSLKELPGSGDRHIYLAVRLTNGAAKEAFALIELPTALVGRYLELPPDGDDRCVIHIDDVVRFCLPMLFPGMGYNTFEAYSFKFTKDAELEMEDTLHEGLVQKVQKAVRNRRKGPTIRVIYDEAMPARLLAKLMGKLKVDKLDTIQAAGRYANHRDLMSFPSFGRTDLEYPPMKPIVKQEIKHDTSLISIIRQRDRFIHVPYHNFDYFIRLLQEAAVSPEVKSIKISLYRVARTSKVVEALICAARNGKKVTAMVEIMARFDEKNNIDYARRMQDAGVNVLFGVEDLKVHAKLVHIGMRKGRDLAVVSTGNFHEGNAKTYTDILLFTARPEVVREVDNVFALIRHPYEQHDFKHLLVSPISMRNRFYQLIDDEIKAAKDGREAWIKIKINHITDDGMVQKLYEASQAGVKIDILVRGCCSLVTPIKGYSENIRAYGIIDRYLEHSRAFIFCAGGKMLTFIGSADWMPRNLDRRIEVDAPVYDDHIKHEIIRMVDAGLRDTVKGRIVDGSGRNLRHTIPDALPFRSQTALYNHYLEENEK